MQNKKILILILLFLTICLFYGFGLQHLTQFKTADEYYWIQERTPQYWSALSNGKIKKTLINDKPGITVALISGVGLLWEKNPLQYLTKIDDDLKTYETSQSERINLLFRLPILIFNGLFIFFFFWIIKKFTQNQWIALWSVILIAFSPILVGISQIINPDSLLWIFSTASIFSYFALLRTNEKKFIFLTAISGGLAVLSKYTADILFPFFFFFMLLYYLIEIRTNTEKIKYFLLSQLSYFFSIILGSILVIAIFLPAVIVKPIYLYRLTLGFGPMKIISIAIIISSALIILDQLFPKKSLILLWEKKRSKFIWLFKTIIAGMFLIFLYLIIGRNIFFSWQLFDIIPFDTKEFSSIKNYPISFWEKIILQFNPLVFSLPPITLLLVLFLWAKTLIIRTIEHSFFIISITCFILIYYLAYILMDIMAIVRYSILIYPLISLLAALGLWQIHLVLERYKLKSKLGLTLALIILSLPSLYLAKPFYFNYTNFLLPQKNIISGSWGYGGYEAAQYLNALPQSKNLTIWSDYYGVCEFFIGKCITDYSLTTGKYTIDYYVLTRRGEIRYRNSQSKWDTPKGIKALPYYENPQSLWKLEIDDRPANFIKILPNTPLNN